MSDPFQGSKTNNSHWSETSEGSTDGKTSETHLSNGGVDDTLLTELVEEALGDLDKKLWIQHGHAKATRAGEDSASEDTHAGVNTDIESRRVLGP